MRGSVPLVMYVAFKLLRLVPSPENVATEMFAGRRALLIVPVVIRVAFRLLRLAPSPE